MRQANIHPLSHYEGGAGEVPLRDPLCPVYKVQTLHPHRHLHSMLQAQSALPDQHVHWMQQRCLPRLLSALPLHQTMQCMRLSGKRTIGRYPEHSRGDQHRPGSPLPGRMRRSVLFFQRGVSGREAGATDPFLIIKQMLQSG